MGSCTEAVVKDYGLTREQQDAHAIMSYTRSAEANAKGSFNSNSQDYLKQKLFR